MVLKTTWCHGGITAAFVLLLSFQAYAAEEWCLMDRGGAGAEVHAAVGNFQVKEPIAIADLPSAFLLGAVANDLQGLVMKALHQHRVPTVEVDENVLDKVLERLEAQSSAMIDQNTAVGLGSWIAAKYLLVGKLEKSPSENMVRFQMRVVNLGNRKQQYMDTLSFAVQDCSLQAGLRSLPAPSQGGKAALPDFEKRR